MVLICSEQVMDADRRFEPGKIDPVLAKFVEGVLPALVVASCRASSRPQVTRFSAQV
jgi:hypothetical protein